MVILTDIKLFICDAKMFSNTFERYGRIDIGRYSLFDLGIGIILGFFQQSGNVDVVKAVLNVCVRKGISLGSRIFINLG